MIKYGKFIAILLALPVIVISVGRAGKTRNIHEILHTAEKFIPNGEGLVLVHLTLPDYAETAFPPRMQRQDWSKTTPLYIREALCG